MKSLLGLIITGLIISNLLIMPALAFTTDSRGAARTAFDKALVMQKNLEEDGPNIGAVGMVTRSLRCISHILFAIYYQNEEMIRLNEETIKLLKENNARKGAY